MTTLAQIVERTKVHLTGAFRGEYSLLASDPGTGTTVTLSSTGTTLQSQSILSIDQELMFVTAVDSTNLICTCIRGIMGTTAVAHTAGAVVEINPRFPGGLIWMALLDEIGGLPEFFYAVKSETYTSTQFSETITLNTSPIDYSLAVGLVDVRRSPQAMYGFDTPLTAYSSWPRMDACRLEIAADTGSFPNGYYLRLGDHMSYGGDIRVTVALRPSTTGLVGTSDLTTVVGLPDSMKDLLAMGTALRLYQVRDIDRTARQGQGESRAAAEVPVGGITQVATSIDRIYHRRMGEELDKLRARYPIRFAFR